jgi:hypothetical protein
VPALQQFINANPVLAVAAVFIGGIVAFLAVRILLENSGCLVRVAVAVVIVIAIFLLLRFMLAR